MKPTLSALFVLILVLLIGDPVISDRLVDPVISDRLVFDNSHGSSSVPTQLSYLEHIDITNPIEIELISIVLLLCIGFVGIISVSRKRSGKQIH